MMSASASSSRTDAAWTPGGSTHNGDVLMTSEHKEILRKHRKELAENLYPEDILTNLQAIKILTSRDVSRIKEKNSEVDMSECLLDTLMKKPDRAFGEFILSLRESDQSHVANVIDKNRVFTPENQRKIKKPQQLHASETEEDPDNHQAANRNRKRKAGELGVRGHIRRIEFDDEEQEEEIDHATARHRGSKSALTAREYQAQEEATTQRITLELLETMEEEVKNLKKVVSRSGLSQASIAQRKAILETMREIRKFHRELNGIESGSVIFHIFCPTLEALDDLCDLCTSGRLRRLMQKDFVTPERLKRHRLKKIDIGVEFSQEEYELCRKELLAQGKGQVSVDCWRETNGEDTEEDEEGSTLPDTCSTHFGSSPPETDVSWFVSTCNGDFEDRKSDNSTGTVGSDLSPFVSSQSSSATSTESSSQDIENISPYDPRWLTSRPSKPGVISPHEDRLHEPQPPDGDFCIMEYISLKSPQHMAADLRDYSPPDKESVSLFPMSTPCSTKLNQKLASSSHSMKSCVRVLRVSPQGGERRSLESRGRSTTKKNVKRVDGHLSRQAEALNLSPRREWRLRSQRSSSPLSAKVAVLHLSPHRLKSNLPH